jgi:hypothetical protein
MSEKMRVRISAGNSKLGFIPSVSFPPVVACAADIPCAKICYAVKMCRFRKNILVSYRANLRYATENPAGFFSDIGRYLEKHTPRFFRFHVSGDFLSADYFRRCVELCRVFPSVRFLAFTKRHDLLPHPRAVPRNFAVVASMWPRWGAPPAGYRCAWFQDGTETRAPRTALECPGNCETCGFCFNIRKLGRDVIFWKH